MEEKREREASLNAERDDDHAPVEEGVQRSFLDEVNGGSTPKP
jgi:hypothetical protein